MTGTNKKATAMLVALGFIASVLAVFGAPVGATAGRAPNFTVAITYQNDTGGAITEAYLGENVTVVANVSIAATQPNATYVNLTLFVDGGVVGGVIGPFAVNTSAPVLKTWTMTPDHYATFGIAVLAQNGNNTGNSTNQTGPTFTVKATDMIIGAVTSDVDSALIGETVTITANVVNLGNMAGRANVTFKLDGSQLLGYKEVDVPAAGNANAVFATDFADLTVSDGNHTVQASMDDLSATSNVTGNITLINPIADVIITGMSVSPMTITIAKGAQVLVTVTASLKNNGTAAAQDFDVYFYMDSTSTKMATIAVNDSVAALATKDVTYSFNATDALALGNHTISVGVGSEATGYWAETTVVVAGIPAVTITEVSVAPVSAFEGVNVTFTAKLFNNGTADAVNQTVEFWDMTTTSKVGEKTNITIGKGLTFDATFVWTLPDVTADLNRTVKAKIGTVEKMVNVTILAKIAKVEGVTLTVATGKRIGDAVTITGTVKNNGTGDAVGVIIDLYDGATKLNSTAAFNLTVGSSKDISLNVTLAGTGDVNHTFSLKYGTVELKNATVSVGHTLSAAAIKVTGFVVKPTLKDKQPKDSTQTYTLTLTLANTGELTGTVKVTIMEGTKVVVTENVTIEGLKSNVTKTYSWKVKGEGAHKAVVTLTGAAGSPATMEAKCDLKYAPGFEVLFLAAAIVVAMVLVRRRKN